MKPKSQSKKHIPLSPCLPAGRGEGWVRGIIVLVIWNWRLGFIWDLEIVIWNLKRFGNIKKSSISKFDGCGDRR
jgi:hypothetical protein